VIKEFRITVIWICDFQKSFQNLDIQLMTTTTNLTEGKLKICI